MLHQKSSDKTVKKRTFRPITRPRYLLGSVARNVWHDDLMMYNRHRSNCFYATPVVDTSPPKMNPHSYIKTKRLADDAAHLVTIDKVNKELLKKINYINRSKGYVDTFNPLAYRSASRWEAHKQKMLKTEEKNKDIYERLVSTKPVYSTAQFDKEWKVNVMKMAHMAKYTLQMFLYKSIDNVVGEMPSISSGLGQLSTPASRPLCYMDFRVKDGVPLGRIIMELYADHVPQAAENFLGLCQNTSVLSYKCCKIYNIVKGQYLETGDVTMNNGKGGASIFGQVFQEKNSLLKHTKPGVLSMIPCGKGYYSSLFSITFDTQKNLDGKRLVFGKIVKGMKTLFQIQDLGKRIGSPTVPIYIESCGEVRVKNKKKNE